uniref:Uncharacterized protein n=1 Tax=Odontella aurita TaxID=265563 RepID=A0A7S4IXF9_9STRA|mmetsp:Transcript_32158/g.96353  ORF Transcript_32158/g.96353 Transcript_32158/m.96353 type:complete len:154 (+) Transcript_32158:80-541(+)
MVEKRDACDWPTNRKASPRSGARGRDPAASAASTTSRTAFSGSGSRERPDDQEASSDVDESGGERAPSIIIDGGGAAGEKAGRKLRACAVLGTRGGRGERPTGSQRRRRRRRKEQRRRRRSDRRRGRRPGISCSHGVDVQRSAARGLEGSFEL